VVGSASPVATVSTLRLRSLIVGSPLPMDATTPGIFCCADAECDKGMKTKTNKRVRARNTPGNDDNLELRYSLQAIDV
jgi:hypothetical protein